MFTGIVEELGTVAARDGAAAAHRRQRRARRRRRSATRSRSTAAASPSSTGRRRRLVGGRRRPTRRSPAPTSARCAPGDPVNLERPVRLADRLGGHLVQGHVDARRRDRRAARPTCSVRMPAELLRYVVEKGSITVDGISLTVVDVARRRLHRRRHPAHHPRSPRSGHKAPGDPVNLEVDVIAKYVERSSLAPACDDQPSTDAIEAA